MYISTLRRIYPLLAKQTSRPRLIAIGNIQQSLSLYRHMPGLAIVMQRCVRPSFVRLDLGVLGLGVQVLECVNYVDLGLDVLGFGMWVYLVWVC